MLEKAMPGELALFSGTLEECLLLSLSHEKHYFTCGREPD